MTVVNIKEFKIDFNNGHLNVNNNKSSVFKVGEKLTGHIVIAGIIKNISGLKLILTGRARCYWRELTGDDTKLDFDDEEKYIFIDVDLDIEDTIKKRKEYKFEFNLPYGLPSSFEGLYGDITYKTTAILSIDHGTITRSVQKEFKLQSYLNLAEYSEISNPIDLNVTKYLLFGVGHLNLFTRIDKSGYVPGEDVKMSLKFGNECDSQIQVNLFLLQETTYHAGQNKITHTEIIESKQGPLIEPHKEEIWNGNLIQIPMSCTPMLDNCKLIDLQYKFLIEMDIPGPHMNLEATIPIIIGTLSTGSSSTGLSREPFPTEAENNEPTTTEVVTDDEPVIIDKPIHTPIDEPADDESLPTVTETSSESPSESSSETEVSESEEETSLPAVDDTKPEEKPEITPGETPDDKPETPTVEIVDDKPKPLKPVSNQDEIPEDKPKQLKPVSNQDETPENKPLLPNQNEAPDHEPATIPKHKNSDDKPIPNPTDESHETVNKNSETPEIKPDSIPVSDESSNNKPLLKQNRSKFRARNQRHHTTCNVFRQTPIKQILPTPKPETWTKPINIDKIGTNAMHNHINESEAELKEVREENPERIQSQPLPTELEPEVPEEVPPPAPFVDTSAQYTGIIKPKKKSLPYPTIIDSSLFPKPMRKVFVNIYRVAEDKILEPIGWKIKKNKCNIKRASNGSQPGFILPRASVDWSHE